MNFNTLRETLQFRIHESEDNYWIEEYWESAIEIFLKMFQPRLLSFKRSVPTKRYISWRKYRKELQEKPKAER